MIAAVGCTQLKPGRCEKDSDCPSGRCDTTTYYCQKPDAGTGGAGGVAGAGGNAGAAGNAGNGGVGGSRDAGMDMPMDRPPPPCTPASCGGETPICDETTHACRACGMKPTDCRDLSAATPVCRPPGEAGRPAACVECTQDSDCKDRTKPVCDQSRNVCVGCAKDDDCKPFPPSVCKAAPSAADAGMPRTHCVGDDEAIYVSMTTGCSDTPTGSATDAGADGGVQGTSNGHPFCSMEPVRAFLSTTRNVVVVTGQVNAAVGSYATQAVGPVLIVGKSATIVGAASPAFQLTNGDVTIRNVAFKTGTGIGIEADGGTLRLDHVTVQNCAGGGIWLNGANFDIQSSTIRSNGPGTYMGFDWGGILETKVPATGLKNISQVTVTANTGQGITCADALTGSGVLATMNVSTPQVSSGCKLQLCSTDAGAMCGAP
ncbi:MAG TPA: hypothetical protein VHO67_18085 [Polyangia bacterium]|nr:hypothetical protein [Polyangia bacterium]